MDRAYSLLTVKAVDAEQRIITGIATSPEPDRVGDVIEPKGVRYKNPLPLLLFHDTQRPVGTVKFFKPTDDGIQFEARLPEIDEPGPLRDRISEAWQSVKAGLVKGVSIGFRALEDGTELMRSGGYRFTKTEVLELSLVTIPANASAVITSIKSLREADHAALGTGSADVTHTSAGASAPVSTTGRKDARRMTLTEQIRSFEAERETKSARRTELMTKSGEEGVTLDDAQEQEYDTLTQEIDKLNKHLHRLEELEKANKAAAVPVNGTTPKAAGETRGGVISIKSNLPPGTGFTRYVMALAASRGSRMEALQFAKRWEKDTPEVGMILKAAVDAGTTTDSTWAAPLVVYQNLASEFIELLRPQTLIGRIPGFRRVPFNVSMPRQTSGSTVGWVGQGVAKPVGELAFDQVSLGMAKAAGIVVISEELARSSNPSAEAVISQDLRAAIAQFLDEQFIDPSVAAVSNVSPASVTNGASVIDSTGTTAAALRADFASALAVWTAADMSIAGGVILMTETQAIRLGMIVNAFGQPEFPNLSATGGTLFGLPVITSENIPAEGGSPAGNRIVLLKPSEILLADDGGISIDVSREASVQMNSAPDSPPSATTVFRSLWQDNLVGIRAERFINWLKRRTAAAVIIEGASYTGA